jgi:hypothetical protein
VLSDRVPELIFWHIPSAAYRKVAPWFGIHQPCVGSINKESVAAQEAEMGIMKLLVKRPSVKVSSQICILIQLTIIMCTYLHLHMHNIHSHEMPTFSVTTQRNILIYSLANTVMLDLHLFYNLLTRVKM